MSLINASIGLPIAGAELRATPHTRMLLGVRLATIIALLALAGCASAPPASVRVDVPAMVPCVGVVPPRPAYEFDKLSSTAMDGEIVLALLRDWSRSRAYEGMLEAVIMGCR